MIGQGNINRVVTEYFDFDMTPEQYQFAINSDNKSYDAKALTLPSTGKKVNRGKMSIKSRSFSVTGLVIGSSRTNAMEIASEIKSKWFGAKATIYDDSGKTLYGYFSNVNHGFNRGAYDGRTAYLNSTFVALDPSWLGADKTFSQTITGATTMHINNTGNFETGFFLDLQALADGSISKDILSHYFTFSEDITVSNGDIVRIDPINFICDNNGINITSKVSDNFFLDPFVMGVNGFDLKFSAPGININCEVNYKERFA